MKETITFEEQECKLYDDLIEEINSISDILG